MLSKNPVGGQLRVTHVSPASYEQYKFPFPGAPQILSPSCDTIARRHDELGVDVAAHVTPWSVSGVVQNE